MKSIILALSLLATMPAMAQIHYCVVNGKKALTDKPCPGQGTEIRPSTINIVQAHPIPEKQSAYGSDGQYQSSSGPQSGDSYACQQAIRNAGVQSTQSRSGSRVEYDRSAAAAACGYDPFSQQRAAEERERERRHERMMQAAENARNTRNTGPTQMSRCSGGFCYDTQGNTYHRNGDKFLNKQGGGTCFRVGNTWNCN